MFDHYKKYSLAIALCALSNFYLFAQVKIRGVVADSASRRPLPFATIQNQQSGEVVIAGISGQFSITIAEKSSRLFISNVGYSGRQAVISDWEQNDTIFLSPLIKSLAEVIIRPDYEKIKRIINTCIRNKPLHNPERYETYECTIYYKMKSDLLPDAATRASLDTGRPKNGRGLDFFLDSSHLLFSEVLSRRFYKRPAHLNEVVIASRFSGLKKTYFSSLVTDVLPFHVYDDYILLGDKDYASPIAKGWEQRYQFRLVDEIKAGSDTIFIMAFRPKTKSKFNGLEGVVYIHSHKYAISHFIGSSTDATGERESKIEQVYTIENGRWFPKELNYDLVFHKYPFPGIGFSVNGHSVISGLSFPPEELLKIDKTYSVRLGDSVDLYTNRDWERFRTDSITARETMTYHIMDSIFQKVKAEKIIAAAGKLVIGRLPLGKFELDITRLMARNKYEGTRVGFGVYTGDKISGFFSTGGWLGYGTKDQVMKYGLSATFFPGGKKDNWVEVRYQKEYQSPGNYRIHPDLDRTGFRNWILSLADEVRGPSLNVHLHKGYWQLDFSGAKQEIFTRYDNGFRYRGMALRAFDHLETGVGVRFAFGEKRIPAFGYYL
ncbi:MAG TPA: DUF5686 family protein, partial [Chitinophagaceae bacterium]|nr:DUF5686 family protein [Chitinophagaceae bacterium]